jgi:hypothetical protein
MRADVSEQPSVFIAVFPAVAGSQTCAAPYHFRSNRSNLCASAPLRRAARADNPTPACPVRGGPITMRD